MSVSRDELAAYLREIQFHNCWSEMLADKLLDVYVVRTKADVLAEKLAAAHKMQEIADSIRVIRESVEFHLPLRRTAVGQDNEQADPL